MLNRDVEVERKGIIYYQYWGRKIWIARILYATLRYPLVRNEMSQRLRKNKTRKRGAIIALIEPMKKKRVKKIPSIKRIKSWIPLINEECDYKGDGNF